MTDESPRSTLDALRAHLNQAGGPQFAGTAGTYAVKSFIDDLHAEIHREIDAMEAGPAPTDRRAIALLVYNEQTDSSSQVDRFSFSPEGMAEAVKIAREQIAIIGRPIIPVIECIGTDSSWYLGPADLKLFFHLSADPRALAAYCAEYLAEREPS